eukprot:TRINITY_DN51068_c0_g1_i1.p1 TRINITY_DN51068_c0_g1~~TRINITY_DN51068_c0_g1_i1.p1  ORF type:complete len:669 (-),score=140.88 TRINITY_DN51068_c0_g1_i1:58-2064(-)
MHRHRGRRPKTRASAYKLSTLLVPGLTCSVTSCTAVSNAFMPLHAPPRAGMKRLPRRRGQGASYLQSPSPSPQRLMVAGPCDFAAGMTGMALAILMATSSGKATFRETVAAKAKSKKAKESDARDEAGEEESDEEEEEEADETEEEIDYDFAGEGAEDIILAVKEAVEKQEDPVQILRQRELITDERSMVQALRALRLGGLHNDVLALFAEMEDYTALPEAYAERMKASEEASQFVGVLEALKEMRTREVKPDIHCLNFVFRILAKSKSWQLATRLLSEMREDDIYPDVHTYDCALAACPTRKKWELAIEILDQMKADGIPLNDSCYHNALHVLSYSPHRGRCIALYTEMRERGMSPSEDAIRYMLRASFGEIHDSFRDPTEVMQTFRGLEEDTNLNLTQVHFDMAMSVLEKERRWKDVLSLASGMGNRGVSPHGVTCNGVLKACVKLGQLDTALSLLATLNREKAELDHHAYSTVLNACAESMRWDEVLTLYEEAEKRFPDHAGSPDMALAAIAALCEVDKTEEASSLYRRSVGSFQRQRRLSGSELVVLDASELSPPVAGIMVRCALEDAAKAKTATSRSAAKNLKLAGFSLGPKDIAVAVKSSDFDASEEALPGSTAASVLQIAQKMLGEGNGLECSMTPFPCVSIPGSAQRAMQEAMSEEQSTA